MNRPTCPSAGQLYELRDHGLSGVALIFNVENFEITEKQRKNSNLDVTRLNNLFRYLSLDVSVYCDCTASEILSLVRQHASKMTATCDILVCVLMSHGGEDYIRGSDWVSLSLEDVYQAFSNDNCRPLMGKPKLFFVQACRGTLPDNGFYWYDNSDAAQKPAERPLIASAPLCSDMVMAYPTQRGYRVSRLETEGSWFVDDLYCVMMEHAAHTDLMTMLNMVSRRMHDRRTRDGERSSPNISTRALRGHVFFRVDPTFQPPSS